MRTYVVRPTTAASDMTRNTGQNESAMKRNSTPLTANGSPNNANVDPTTDANGSRDGLLKNHDEEEKEKDSRRVVVSAIIASVIDTCLTGTRRRPSS